MRWHVIYSPEGEDMFMARFEKVAKTLAHCLFGRPWKVLELGGYTCKPMDIDIYEPGGDMPDPTQIINGEESPKEH